MYLVDAEQNQVAQVKLTLNDFTGRYSSSTLQVKKQLEGSVVTMTENAFDVENKVIIYLISADKYQLYIQQGSETRSIGNFVVDPTDLEKTITIGNIYLTNVTYGNFSYSFTFDNETGQVVAVFIDPSNMTDYVDFYLYNYTTSQKGDLVYHANATGSTVEFTYDGNGDESYYAVLEVHHQYYGEESIVLFGILIGTVSTMVPFLFPFSFVGTLPVAWATFVSMLIILGIPMLFGSKHAMVGVIMAVIIAGLLSYWGWFEISALILIAVGLLAALYKFTEKESEYV